MRPTTLLRHSLSPSPSPPSAALRELCGLETFLAEKLEDVRRSGRASSTLFLRAVEELHGVLAQSLAPWNDAVQPVEDRGALPASDPAPDAGESLCPEGGHCPGEEPCLEDVPVEETPAASVSGEPEVLIPAELDLAEDEFLLDFGDEILCLHAAQELPGDFLPTGLRRRKARTP